MIGMDLVERRDVLDMLEKCGDVDAAKAEAKNLPGVMFEITTCGNCLHADHAVFCKGIYCRKHQCFMHKGNFCSYGERDDEDE